MTENQQIRRVPCELCDGIAKWEHKGKRYCPVCIEQVTLRALIFSRVVGYYSPVQKWHAGKRQEFKDRVTYGQPTPERLAELDPVHLSRLSGDDGPGQ